MNIETLDSYGFCLETRQIRIFTEIHKGVLDNVMTALMIMQSSDEEIDVVINSPGGCLVSSLAIYDLLSESPNIINGYVVGDASSGASLILQGCDNRYISKRSCIMIHYGTHAMPHDLPQNNERLTKQYNKYQDDMVECYKNRMKSGGKRISAKKLDEFLTFDSYFDSKNAIKYGLADYVYTYQPTYYKKSETKLEMNGITAIPVDQLDDDFLDKLLGELDATKKV